MMDGSNQNESTTAVQEATSTGPWSVGVVATKGTQLPGECLRHCLEGDPDSVGERGCAFLRDLVQRATGDTAASHEEPDDLDVPPICDQGLAVSLFDGDVLSAPDVLILRPPTDSPAAYQAIASALGTLREAAVENWRLNHENDGLADEVLRSYEQINLIFDISAQIAILTDADEVLQTLLSKLRQLFSADAVFLVFADRTTGIRVDRHGHAVRGWIAPSDAAGSERTRTARSASKDLPPLPMLELPPQYQTAQARLNESRRVFVCEDESGRAARGTGHGTAMWGALAEGEHGFSIVGAVRSHTPFTSGDMLLLDSTLTYAGHIVRNLKLVEQLKQTSIEVVRAMVNAIDQKDAYTSGHSERVGFLARATGQQMGLASKQLQELEWAGLLHDIGKIGIPENVLNKPGRLSDTEYHIIQGHPTRGHEILDPVASLEPVIEGVLYHHENPDGSGYPEGLTKDEIPLLARIIHVVDVFDALTSTRSYRQAFPAEKALAIIQKDAGTKLDDDVVAHFMRTWSQLPVTHPEEYARWFGEGPREGEE